MSSSVIQPSGVSQVAVIGLGLMGSGVLEAMHAATGDPAFTPVPLLAEYATAGTRFRARADG
jgi:3-hydroxyacyl-CoA dehydrogenase